jgi:hypothetical protein
MTSAGYITDQRCPSNPEHGRCWDQASGMFCPHSDHHINSTQFFWTFDQWETIKSLTTGTEAPNEHRKLKLESPSRRFAKPNHRRARKTNRA